MFELKAKEFTCTLYCGLFVSGQHYVPCHYSATEPSTKFYGVFSAQHLERSALRYPVSLPVRAIYEPKSIYTYISIYLL